MVDQRSGSLGAIGSAKEKAGELWARTSLVRTAIGSLSAYHKGLAALGGIFVGDSFTQLANMDLSHPGPVVAAIASTIGGGVGVAIVGKKVAIGAPLRMYGQEAKLQASHNAARVGMTDAGSGAAEYNRGAQDFISKRPSPLVDRPDAFAGFNQARQEKVLRDQAGAKLFAQTCQEQLDATEQGIANTARPTAGNISVDPTSTLTAAPNAPPSIADAKAEVALPVAETSALSEASDPRSADQGADTTSGVQTLDDGVATAAVQPSDQNNARAEGANSFATETFQAHNGSEDVSLLEVSGEPEEPGALEAPRNVGDNPEPIVEPYGPESTSSVGEAEAEQAAAERESTEIGVESVNSDPAENSQDPEQTEGAVESTPAGYRAEAGHQEPSESSAQVTSDQRSAEFESAVQETGSESEELTNAEDKADNKPAEPGADEPSELSPEAPAEDTGTPQPELNPKAGLQQASIPTADQPTASESEPLPESAPTSESVPIEAQEGPQVAPQTAPELGHAPEPTPQPEPQEPEPAPAPEPAPSPAPEPEPEPDQNDMELNF